MLFNSIDFAVFLPIVFLAYWALKSSFKLQNGLILIASYVFYGWWDWKFLSLIAFSTVVDYLVGLYMDRSSQPGYRKMLLGISLSVNLGLLFFFKYFNFFIGSFEQAFSLFGQDIHLGTLNIILPVGISFYTFQTMSYSIDLYKGKISPTRDFIAFASFVSFFPQLVAGPIERAAHLLPQFKRNRTLNVADVSSGIDKILFGLFKKVVIADRAAVVVNEVFAHHAEYQGFQLVLGVVLFAFQIYCDFSGYSDIAIGTARLFGFDLMTNFNAPYLSRSLGEFWRRWHISLSTWFRDYVYIPLGGSKAGKTAWYRNLMIVFLVSGFWHGANWTFIVWGGIHGLALLLEAKFNFTETRVFKISMVRNVYVWVVVCLGWVFFRSDTVTIAFEFVIGLFDLGAYSLSQLTPYIIPTTSTHVFAHDVMLALVFIGILLLAEWITERGKEFHNWGYWLKVPIYSMTVVAIYLFGVFENNAFIYFQF